MKNFISVIFMNFWGYDLIIAITAVVTGIVFFRLHRSAENLYKKMHLTVFVPDGRLSSREADSDMSGLRETEVVTMRNHTGKLYSIFVNLTGIFPLLGILGTVISLLGLVADTSDITGNFYGALTSTFWGLVFAIVFKFLDGVISAKIEDNEKSVALYLERNNFSERPTIQKNEYNVIKNAYQHEAADESRQAGEKSSVAIKNSDYDIINNLLASLDDKI
ncbi:MAG: MotA/TolQ/ExbB proton channel family protein [Ruminococcus sp.]|nr:MotA/TolQ/ExbB proton channel family protein [Ruminococcus sp.]